MYVPNIMFNVLFEIRSMSTTNDHHNVQIITKTQSILK